MGGRVAVSLEGSVDDIGTGIDEIWHNWLILRAVPRNISWLSLPVSVARLVVLMEDWSLSRSPFSMSIWHWWVLWENSAQVPPEHVWVVEEGSSMELVVVEDDWSLVSQSSSETLAHKPRQPGVCEPASDIKVLNWELSNDGKSKDTSELASSGIRSPVPVGLAHWSHDNIISLIFWEPRLEDFKISLGLWGPLWKPFLDFVGR